jgi:hypothetical protein
MDSLKRCVKCKQVKPLSDFVTDRSRKDGHYPYCGPCRRASQKQYRLTHPRGSVAFQRYSHEELLSRPIEHSLETYTCDELAEIWGVDRCTAHCIRTNPGRIRLNDSDPFIGEPYLTNDLINRLRDYQEAACEAR